MTEHEWRICDDGIIRCSLCEKTPFACNSGDFCNGENETFMDKLLEPSALMKRIGKHTAK